MSFEFDYALGGLKRMQIYAIFDLWNSPNSSSLFEMVRSQVLDGPFFGTPPKRIEVDTLTSHFSVAICQIFWHSQG